MRSKDIRQTAFRILARRDHTRRELYNKLLQRGYLPCEAGALCQELVEQGYMSDSRVAANLLENASIQPAAGALRFRQRLQSRGLPPALIEDTVKTYREQVDASAVAQRLAQALFARGKDAAFIERHLWRKGFSTQEIRAAVRALDDTCIDNGQPEG